MELLRNILPEAGKWKKRGKRGGFLWLVESGFGWSERNEERVEKERRGEDGERRAECDSLGLLAKKGQGTRGRFCDPSTPSLHYMYTNHNPNPIHLTIRKTEE